MRILTTVSDQAWGGKHRYMYDILLGLQGLGHWVAVLCEQDGRFARRGAAGCALQIIGGPPFTSEPGPADEALARAVRQEKPDVLIATGRRDLMAVHRTRQALGQGQPFVFFRHSAFPLSGQESAPELLSSITHIVGTSRQQIDEQFGPFVQAGIVDLKAVSLIPSGVASAAADRVAACDATVARRRLGIDPDAFIFLIMARLSWEKGIALAIEALAALPDKESVLVLAGEGPERGALEAAAAHCGVGERVLFLGHLDDIDEPLSVANAVMLTSVVPETGPLALKEAMAAGKAIIAPGIGGIPEFVRAGQNGLLYEPGNRESLIAAMLQLIDQEDLGSRLGREGARTMRAAHRLERRVTHLSWLLDLLLLQDSPVTTLRELRWNYVRLRSEEHFTFLFVPETSHLTEVPADAIDALRQSISRGDPSLLVALEERLRSELVVRLFQMGALHRADARRATG